MIDRIPIDEMKVGKSFLLDEARQVLRLQNHNKKN